MTPAKVIGPSHRPSSHNPVSSDDELDFDVNQVPDNQPDFVENSLQNFNNIRPSTENNPTTSRSGRLIKKPEYLKDYVR